VKKTGFTVFLIYHIHNKFNAMTAIWDSEMQIWP